MELSEHVYADDPTVGHPDVRTRLRDTDYFFLGNGRIHAAVQVCRSGEGTPVGLLIMHPGRFGPKRAALTCVSESGLEPTAINVRIGETRYCIDPDQVQASWEDLQGVPAVRVAWTAGPVSAVERFFCPSDTEPRIARRIDIRLPDGMAGAVSLHLGLAGQTVLPVTLQADGTGFASLVHAIVPNDDGPVIETRWEAEVRPGSRARQSWDRLTTCRTGHEDLDHIFSAARVQLPTAVDHRGRMDGSIWQYNLEWVRDQSHVSEALVRLGEHAKARTMLARLLDQFVSPDGDTVDSGRRRPAADVELDQNGELLAALCTYVDWTGDLDLVASRWQKIRALAGFPLQPRFRHSASALLHNRREYWERHAEFGIEDGFELMSQFFVALGLEQIAHLADLLGHSEDRDLWRQGASRLRYGMLEDPRYRLVEDGHLIKRRGTDGVWQREIHMTARGSLPQGIPMLQDSPHLLDPDTSSVLPIAHEFIDPCAALATNTLAHVEELWNQQWNTGGYGRYHASSEADSPGAWPFASLFVARACAEAGRDDEVWRILRWLAATPGGKSGAWFENDGPRIAPPYAQLGFTPWTWAELITLFVHHLLGVRPDTDGVTLRPRLLEGLDTMEASMRVREHRLDLHIRRAVSGEERCGLLDVERLRWSENGIRLPVPESDFAVNVVC